MAEFVSRIESEITMEFDNDLSLRNYVAPQGAPVSITREEYRKLIEELAEKDFIINHAEDEKRGRMQRISELEKENSELRRRVAELEKRMGDDVDEGI